MKFTWFNLMPWPYLPDDFREKHRSVWVDIPSRLYDPERGHHVYHEYMRRPHGAVGAAGAVRERGAQLPGLTNPGSADGTIQMSFHHGRRPMALNIKDRETERLAAEVAALAGESKTRAVKVALEERKQRLALEAPPRDRRSNLLRFLQEEAWPLVPRRVLGKRISKKEREAILGYGPDGA